MHPPFDDQRNDQGQNGRFVDPLRTFSLNMVISSPTLNAWSECTDTSRCP